MTIAELIQRLEEMPRDALAYVGSGRGPVRGVSLRFETQAVIVVVEP